MTSPTSLVDWRLAERAAFAVGGDSGRRCADLPGAFDHEEVTRACAEALEPAAAYAGLGSPATLPAVELIDRRRWAATALPTLAAATEPLEGRLAAELRLPGPLGAVARGAAGAALGAEVGLAVGYMSRRVLGQYDLALFGPERPGRLLFIAENLAAAPRELEVERGLFLRWIALHETTHVIQFERVDWLLPHLRGLAAELVEGARAGLESAALRSLGRRLVTEPRERVRSVLRGDLGRQLLTPAQSETLDRLQAVMSAIEGHAEHVMDAALPPSDSGVAELRRALARRRARGGLSELIGRLLGLGLKLRQYELGKAFCDAVVADAGPAALRRLWRSPESLPDLAELERPALWLARVGEPSPHSA